MSYIACQIPILWLIRNFHFEYNNFQEKYFHRKNKKSHGEIKSLMKKRKKVLKIEKVSWRNKNLMGKIERLRNKKSHEKVSRK